MRKVTVNDKLHSMERCMVFAHVLGLPAMFKIVFVWVFFFRRLFTISKKLRSYSFDLRYFTASNPAGYILRLKGGSSEC